MQTHELKRKTPNKKAKLVGRGGSRGKTSGRGTKGQKARSGNSMRPEMRDLIKKIPKLRGHGKNRSRTINTGRVKAHGVNIKTLDQVFESGATINPETLFANGLVRRKNGKMPAVKVLGTGETSKKFSIEQCEVSASAKEKIEKAGGAIVA